MQVRYVTWASDRPVRALTTRGIHRPITTNVSPLPTAQPGWSGTVSDSIPNRRCHSSRPMTLVAVQLRVLLGHPRHEHHAAVHGQRADRRIGEVGVVLPLGPVVLTRPHAQDVGEVAVASAGHREVQRDVAARVDADDLGAAPVTLGILVGGQHHGAVHGLLAAAARVDLHAPLGVGRCEAVLRMAHLVEEDDERVVLDIHEVHRSALTRADDRFVSRSAPLAGSRNVTSDPHSTAIARCDVMVSLRSVIVASADGRTAVDAGVGAAVVSRQASLVVGSVVVSQPWKQQQTSNEAASSSHARTRVRTSPRMTEPGNRRRSVRLGVAVRLVQAAATRRLRWMPCAVT